MSPQGRLPTGCQRRTRRDSPTPAARSYATMPPPSNDIGQAARF